MKKLVVKLDLHDDRDKQKALKTVSTLRGIDSMAMDMKEKKLTVIGTVDPVDVVSKLRKYWQTDLVSVGPAKEPEKEKKEEPKKEEAKKEDASKDEGKKEEGGGGGGKEEAKKGGGGEKEEAKKDDQSKPEEGKKDDEKKDDAKKDEQKEQPKRPLALPPPQQFNPYMMDYYARGYRPPYNPYMNQGPYNPYMNGYNPYMTTHNPYMVSHNPPVSTHYYVPSAEENPGGCTIC